MAPKTGGNMKLYRNTGTFASPTWLEMAEIEDVNLSDFTRTMAELKRRSSQFTASLPAIFQALKLTLKQWHGLDATNFDAIRANHFNGTIEEWAIMDGSITVSGSQGMRIPVTIEQWPWSQNLEEVSAHDLTVCNAYWESPTGTSRDPTWISVPTTTTTP